MARVRSGARDHLRPKSVTSGATCVSIIGGANGGEFELERRGGDGKVEEGFVGYEDCEELRRVKLLYFDPYYKRKKDFNAKEETCQGIEVSFPLSYFFF